MPESIVLEIFGAFSVQIKQGDLYGHWFLEDIQSIPVVCSGWNRVFC
jgi:hypothetical protein